MRASYSRVADLIRQLIHDRLGDVRSLELKASDGSKDGDRQQHHLKEDAAHRPTARLAGGHARLHGLGNGEKHIEKDKRLSSCLHPGAIGKLRQHLPDGCLGLEVAIKG